MVPGSIHELYSPDGISIILFHLSFMSVPLDNKWNGELWASFQENEIEKFII
jgi:hypothetical protein